MRIKINRYILFFLTLAFSFPVTAQKAAVTYTFSGGRFGDCLISYCHAFWIAYTFGLDFLYKPFKYSDQMLMHETDTLYSQSLAQNYKQILHINSLFAAGVQPDTLYIVPFFCESHIERDDPRCPFLFQVDWKNKDFIKALKTRIAPKYQLLLPQLPDDGVSVALHVRKGTGWDIPQFAPTFEKLTEMHPLKWPPDSYYIGQIEKLIEFLPDQNLYIHLFTDHDKPQQIIDIYNKKINNPRIKWSCRQQDNRQDLNVLEDFFALIQFDCLIRNDSNFSIVASKLGEYHILIAPWHSKMHAGQIIIDEVVIEHNLGL